MAFPGHPDLQSPAGTLVIFQFPCKEFPHIHRVFDCVGSGGYSPWIVPFGFTFRSSNNVGTLDGCIGPAIL